MREDTVLHHPVEELVDLVSQCVIHFYFSSN
jgi:hypothetical protein